jgi:hypothetical protein
MNPTCVLAAEQAGFKLADDRAMAAAGPVRPHQPSHPAIAGLSEPAAG